MHRLICILFCLILPFSTSAEPAVAISEDSAGIAASISGLDADRTYWVTIVSPDADEGAYTSFEYITGSDHGAVSFSDPETDQPMELRLHEKSDGNPLLARVMLTTSAEPAKSLADARTLDFASRYGLAGDWQGEMQCDQGAGRFQITLRPHVDENGYIGDLHLTLIDGPDKGATGVWPFLVRYSPEKWGDFSDRRYTCVGAGRRL